MRKENHCAQSREATKKSMTMTTAVTMNPWLDNIEGFLLILG